MYSLAAVTSHIPNRGEHLVRYYGLPGTGIEPVRGKPRGILSPCVCQFRHPGVGSFRRGYIRRRSSAPRRVPTQKAPAGRGGTGVERLHATCTSPARLRYHAAMETTVDVAAFAAQVARNCLVADAQRWGYFSLCGLLLRLRELYKREAGLEPWARVETAAVLPWVGEREAAWAPLEDAEFAPLVVGGATLDPLDEDGANRLLIPAGCLYVAGQGPGGHPLFVLGEILERRGLDDGVELFVVGRELAHDLVPVPAMCRPGRIVARRDAVRGHLWATLEEAAGAREPSPAEDAVAEAGGTLAALVADPEAHAGALEALARAAGRRGGRTRAWRTGRGPAAARRLGGAAATGARHAGRDAGARAQGRPRGRRRRRAAAGADRPPRPGRARAASCGRAVAAAEGPPRGAGDLGSGALRGLAGSRGAPTRGRRSPGTAGSPDCSGFSTAIRRTQKRPAAPKRSKSS